MSLFDTLMRTIHGNQRQPMTPYLVNAQTGTPLTILSRQQFPEWLLKQSKRAQRWLASLGFSGSGLALLPDGKGELSEALWVVESLQDPWLAGDLAKLLPKGHYWIADPELRAQAAYGFALGAYQFAGYKEVPAPGVALVIPDMAQWQQIQFAVLGAQLTRDLINTPANDMMPEHLAQVMQELAEGFEGQFSQWVGDELLQHNFPCIHMVGRASCHAPRLLELRWGQADAPKLTLVGKGVCFDSGGLDLKSGSGMRLMKKDMGGAAHVLGLAYLIMAYRLPVQLRVLVPAVENAVSSNAFRPGDVVRTRSGLTVEIDNTDAEGRLVLCDALTLAEEEQPDLLIDFATLTGACRVALGTELPGLFAQQLDSGQQLVRCGQDQQDPLWQLPLHAPYRDLLKSEVADLVNSAASPYAGAITAALFLQHFVAPERDWLHVDVMAWNVRPLPGRPVGGEAMGLRATLAMIQARFSS